MKTTRYAALWLLAAALLTTPAMAAEAPTAAVDQPAPAFTLKDVATGNDISLADYQGKTLVIVFQSINCPWDKMRESGGYQRVLSPLAAQMADQNIAFLAINSNRTETVEEVASYQSQHNMPYPIVKDPGNQIADLYNARTTPHFFVIRNDESQTLAYMGGFEKAPASPEQCGEMGEAYLVPVLNALVAGEPLPYTNTKSKGCSIKRERK